MKVVIIDDEPLISDKLKRIMETGLRGMHTVCAFTDAQTALDYIEQEKPGVILTDIRMPVFFCPDHLAVRIRFLIEK